jgi:hypothetical protein
MREEYLPIAQIRSSASASSETVQDPQEEDDAPGLVNH